MTSIQVMRQLMEAVRYVDLCHLVVREVAEEDKATSSNLVISVKRE